MREPGVTPAGTERRFAPAAARNQEPIAEMFAATMPTTGAILEIASGSGEHGVHLCTRFPGLQWHPTDPNAQARASINAWRTDIPDDRMARAQEVHTDHDDWWRILPPTQWAGITCINMIHIAPWAACVGLFQGAAQLLPVGQRLFLYGPYKRDGEMAESNCAFDADLKRRNASWGVRDLDLEVTPLAEKAGFTRIAVHEMPANNLTVVFERS